MDILQRTVTCGELRLGDRDREVILNGWVDAKRDHGGIYFINLRDRYGITQIVADASVPDAVKEAAAALHNEFCVAVRGIVRYRPKEMRNNAIKTGYIEVVACEIAVLNACETPPFQIAADGETGAKEELRLKYRYLDLRSGGMQRRIALRSAVTFACREFLTKEGFLEIETPTFIKSTPEGARDYLVPSRLYAGHFYALPQSPQIYKQLLMVSGFDKYFQIARCYRDEDARGDRQPEFTQIDIEMSFVCRDDVLELTESLIAHIFKKTLNVGLPAQFTRLSYDEAISRFGTDKPDLRFGMELLDFASHAKKADFNAFKSALDAGGAVKALVAKGCGGFSRKQIDELEAQCKIYKAKGMAWFKVCGGSPPLAAQSSPLPPNPYSLTPSLEGGIAKFFAPQAQEICEALGAESGDLVLVVADSKSKTACTALGAARSKLGRDLGLCDAKRFEFAWIVDFPLFEFNEEENRWEAAHHLFSYPQEKYHSTLESDPGAVKGDLYDLVLNGYELASGSIRIHDPALQKRVFAIAGIGEAEAEQKFGFLTTAFKYGAPPHGGIAPGLDRLVMLMSGESSIKEVIAFPKNSFAQSPMDDCPSPVDEAQLKDLHLKIV